MFQPVRLLAAQDSRNIPNSEANDDKSFCSFAYALLLLFRKLLLKLSQNVFVLYYGRCVDVSAEGFHTTAIQVRSANINVNKYILILYEHFLIYKPPRGYTRICILEHSS
jgi:hypothetical protein